MTFDELLAEYESPDRIGELIWALLLVVTRNVCRRYPPAVYADNSTWTNGAIEDLAQSVALERLLGEGQLDYIFTIAGSDRPRGLNTVKGLMGLQVKRTLAHRRTPSVVDRLVRRIQQLLRDSDCTLRATSIGKELWVHAGDSHRTPSELTPADRSRGGHAIALIPRIPSNPHGRRESKVYARPQLEAVVERLVEEFDGIYVSDIRRVLEDLLTAWLPEILYDPDGVEAVAAEPLEEFEMRQLAEQAEAVVERLSSSHVTVMVGKSNGVPDSQLAAVLGCSRPTIIKYKRELGDFVQRELLDGVPAARHPLVMELLLEQALERGGGEFDGHS